MIGGLQTVVFVALAFHLVLGPTLTGFLFGIRDSLAFLYLDIAVEPSPPGPHIIHQFGMRGDFREPIKTLLNHSIAYQSPEVIAGISTWIRNVTVPMSARSSKS